MKHKCPDCGLSLTEDCGWVVKGIWKCIHCLHRGEWAPKTKPVDSLCDRQIYARNGVKSFDAIR